MAEIVGVAFDRNPNHSTGVLLLHWFESLVFYSQVVLRVKKQNCDLSCDLDSQSTVYTTTTQVNFLFCQLHTFAGSLNVTDQGGKNALGDAAAEHD